MKDKIRASGFPVFDTSDPERLASHLEHYLWQELDARFPAEEVPDPHARENARHEAYALARRRLYLGGGDYFNMLETLLQCGSQRILVTGGSGSGKSALLANWAQHHRSAHPDHLVHEHYLGASGEASEPSRLAHRWMELIRRVTESGLEIADDPEEMVDQLPLFLAEAGAFAERQKTRWVFLLDSLNSLTDLRDLRWLPEFLPSHVHLVVSCLDGDVREALVRRGSWDSLEVKPLSPMDGAQLVGSFLGRFNKTLPESLAHKLLAHPLAGNPLFLRTLAEELRVFGVHEQLEARLDSYLASQTVDDLFERVLQRVEEDCGMDTVRGAIESLWASRSGLTELEIQGINRLVPAAWATIRHALDESLLESTGRITFGHDHMRLAVRDRYLSEIQDQAAAHRRLAEWVSTTTVDLRRAEEEPWQWRLAGDWDALKACLLDQRMFLIGFHERPEGEWLGHWLELESRDQADLEPDLETVWPRWFNGANHSANLHLCASLVDFLGHAGRVGDFTLGLTKLLVEQAEAVHGGSHTETANALATRAKIAEDIGDFETAMSCCRRALAMREATLGANAEETASSINQMGRLHQKTGDLATARRLTAQALSIVEKTAGPRDTRLASALCGYGSILHAQGDLAEAEPILRRALKVNEEALGPGHPDTAATMSSLAYMLHSMGRWEEAIGLHTKALETRRQSLGPFHPLTAESTNNIALVHQARGDLESARPLLELALRINQKAYGEQHPVVGLALNNLALLLHLLGKTAEAERQYRQALAIQIDCFGPNHPDTANTLSNLACLVEEGGDLSGAESLHRQALAARENTLGTDHPDTANSLANLAELLVKRGETVEAIDLHRRALEARRDSLGYQHPHTLLSLNNLGLVLENAGQTSEALELLMEAAEGLHLQVGPGHPKTIDVYKNTLDAARKSKNPGQAIPALGRLLDLGEKLFGRESRDFGVVLYRIGNALARLGDIAAAKQLLEEEIRLAERLEGRDSDSFKSSIKNLAKVLGKA